jgi:hypothetical protein
MRPKSDKNQAVKKTLIVVAAIIAFISCHSADNQASHFVAVRADSRLALPSAYPVAIDPSHVGGYSPDTNSGAGYFYDDVLEYRVWQHPEKGAPDLNSGSDYYWAFAQYERAAEYAKKSPGAERPLVLIRQREWIDEPQPKHYIAKRGERITEWQVEWLQDSKRSPDSIKNFLAHPRPMRESQESDAKAE